MVESLLFVTLILTFGLLIVWCSSCIVCLFEMFGSRCMFIVVLVLLGITFERMLLLMMVLVKVVCNSAFTSGLYALRLVTCWLICSILLLLCALVSCWRSCVCVRSFVCVSAWKYVWVRVDSRGALRCWLMCDSARVR